MPQLNLQPPTSGQGMVRRDSLLHRIERSDATVVAVVAPAGYGKTTLLTQLMELRPGSAWLRLEARDNDPAVLLDSLWTTLAGAGLINSDPPDTSLRSDLAVTKGVPRLVEAIERTSVPGTLFLDQVEDITATTSLDVLDALLRRLPQGLGVVLGTRSTDRLSLALLRSQGTLLELSAGDLAMDAAEASELVGGLGIRPGADDLEVLLARTEGWPAGLYLAGLALATAPSGPGILEVRGTHRFLSDYLRDEVLGDVSDADLSVLVGSSILRELSGPLCDHVLQTRGSGELLDRFERSSRLVVALDHGRTWFRCHSLLKDHLAAEFDRREPGLAAPLHVRASEWFEANDLTELAIDHAMASGDDDRVAALVRRAARTTFALGHMEALAEWFTWLEDRGSMARHPDVAGMASLLMGIHGDAGRSHRLSVLARSRPDGSPLTDDELHPLAKLARAFRVERGLEQALADATAARVAMPPDWAHVPLGAEGVTLICLGDLDTADPTLAEAADLSRHIDALPFHTGCLAGRALIASMREEWDEAARMAAQSVALIVDAGIEEYLTSALPFAVSARVAIRSGRTAEATTLLGRASAIRPRLGASIPILSVLSLLEMVRSYIELGDMGGARLVIREVSDIMAIRPDLGALTADRDALRSGLAALPSGRVGASSLTTAELRVLPLLVTHLSYPAIAERLYVSRHTVKTQAMSIYRKLGVSSRAEAVEAARGLGLISA